MLHGSGKAQRNRLAPVSIQVHGLAQDGPESHLLLNMVKVALSNYRGNLVHAVTNEFGEFRCDIDNSGDLELSVPGRDDTPITISLRNALRHALEEKV